MLKFSIILATLKFRSKAVPTAPVLPSTLLGSTHRQRSHIYYRYSILIHRFIVDKTLEYTRYCKGYHMFRM